MTLPSAQCESRSGCAGLGGGGGGATSTEKSVEPRTPRPLAPGLPTTPRLLTSGEDATGCSCSSAIVDGMFAGAWIRPSRRFDELTGPCLLAGGASAGGG